MQAIYAGFVAHTVVSPLLRTLIPYRVCGCGEVWYSYGTTLLILLFLSPTVLHMMLLIPS